METQSSEPSSKSAVTTAAEQAWDHAVSAWFSAPLQTLEDLPRLYELREAAKLARERALWALLPPHIPTSPVRGRSTDAQALVRQCRRRRSRRLRLLLRKADYLTRQVQHDFAPPWTSSILSATVEHKNARVQITQRLPVNQQDIATQKQYPGWQLRNRRRRLALQGPHASQSARIRANQDDATLNSGILFGLNNLQSFRYAGDEDSDGAHEIYGEADDIYNDTANLGASVVRQPGSRELMLSSMLGSKLPLLSGMRIAVAAYKEKLTAELKSIYAAGQTVVLLMVVNGGGGDERVPLSADGKVELLIPLDWSLHTADGVSIGGRTFNDTPGITSGTDTLDIRNEYQTQYLCNFVAEVCTLLSTIEAETFPIVGLDSVVAGLELLNEVDICNIMPVDYAPDGKYGAVAATITGLTWARFIYQLARVVAYYFWNRIPVWMPGLSSFSVSDSIGSDKQKYIHGSTWQINYFKAFTAELGNLWSAEHSGVDPSTLFGNVDLHWYHRERARKDTVGTLHIGAMALYVSALRNALDDAGYVGTDISVMESGVTVYDASEDFAPDMLSADLETWQAWEVWRRLFGALAAGASIVGWNSWRSAQSNTNPFYQMGLREDLNPTLATDASQRKAWFAYDRLTLIVQSLSSAQMVVPELSSSPLVLLDSESDTVVIEVQGRLCDPGSELYSSSDDRIYSYGYLVFRDLWRNTEEEVVLGLTAATGGSTHIVQIPLFFEGTSGVLATDGLPATIPEYNDSTTSTVPAHGRHLSVIPDYGPRLFLSPVRLSWVVL